VRFTVAMVGALGVLVVGAVVASAHATLLSTSPAQSATYPSGKPPPSVSVTFDEAVDATTSSIHVYGSKGKAVPGATVPKAVTTAHVLAPLPHVGDGTFVVVWHIVSDDGHPEQGAFTFTVGAATGTSANIGGLLAEQSAGRVIGLGFGADRFLVFLACFLFVGGAVFLTIWWPDVLGRRRVVVLLAVSGGVAIIGTLASLPLQAAYTSGGASKLFDGSALSSVLDARFGQAVLWRVGLLVVLEGSLLFAARARSTTGRAAVAMVTSLSALGVWATFAYAGHGDTGRLIPLGFAGDVIHLTAGSLWLGGLVLLGVAMFRSVELADDARAAARFSAVALPAIAVVILSGTVQAWRQIGSWWALRHSTYGHVLIAKVLLVVAIVIVASAGRDAVRSRMLTDPEGRRDLLRGLWTEAAIALGVLALTSVLVVSAPGREVEATTKVPTAHTVQASASSARLAYTIVLQPAIPGDNTIVVTPRARTTHQFLPVKLEGVATTPDGRSRTITFTPLPDGRWVAAAPLPDGSARLTLVADDGTGTDRATAQLHLS
jgi:copper transport protein